MQCWFGMGGKLGVKNCQMIVKNHEIADKIMKEVEEYLGRIGMSIKGWAVSYRDPPEQLTADGCSVSFAGMLFYPKIDFSD